jgi:hypothetical protein
MKTLIAALKKAGQATEVLAGADDCRILGVATS